jgi:Outer membrane protein beta-barrel domain
MSDHNFEKQVQQKLDELKVPPSDRVWSAVEDRIRKDKLRRRGIIFFSLLLLLLVTAGYFVYQNTLSSGNDSGSESFSTNKSAYSSDPVSENSKATPDLTVQEQRKSKKSDGHRSDKQVITDIQTGTEKNVDNTIKNEKPGNSENAGRALSQNENQDEKYFPGNRTGANNPEKNAAETNTTRRDKNKERKRSDHNQLIIGKGVSEKSAEGTLVQKERGVEQKEAKQEDAIIDTQITSAPDSLNANSVTAASEDRKADSATDLVQQNTIDSAFSNSIAQDRKAAGKKEKQSSWKWGINAGAGISNFQEGSLFDNVLGNLFGSADAAANANYSASGSPAVVPTPSAIEKGFSFSVGVFAQKNLSKRFSLSTGLQYSYYSTHMEVGVLVDSARMVQNALGATNVNQYYRAAPMSVTNSYTNQFHFIELPVQFHLQLNKGERLPLYWNGGLSLSYLVSTNALHFDGRTGVYYKDNDLFNKVQANLSTGFSASLWSKSKIPVHIGPQVQYGFTNLINRDVSTGTHLLYFGLNTKIFLKK